MKPSEFKDVEVEKIISHEKYLILPEKFFRHTFDYDLAQLDTENKPLSSEPSIDFTPRELDCIVLLMQGYTFKMIASKLGISPRTVETYIENIKQKTGCFSKGELIKFLQKQRGAH
jgi:DNA-binding CsgD family transcriptional regulator